MSITILLVGWTHTLVGIGLLCYLARFVYQKWTGPLSSIPGPWISRWTGSLLSYHRVRGNGMKYIHKLHEQYGPVVRISPHEVDVSDISAVKTIHGIGSGFMKSPFYERFTCGDIRNSFNSSDPEFYGPRRRLLSSTLSDTSIRRFEPLIESRVRLTIQKMHQELKGQGVTDVHAWWMFMTADVIGDSCFGRSFRMLETGKKSENDGDSTFRSLRAAFPGIVALANLLPISFLSKTAEAGNRMEMYCAESVKLYRSLALDDPNRIQTLLTKFFETSLTDAEVTDEAMNFIIAGSDTTATTLTYLVWAVCSNPAIKESLVSELANLPSDFKDQDLRGLPYLNQVIDETLRVYAATPSGLPRVSSQNSVLASHCIPAGTTITTQAYSLHRDADIFPDPEKFDPSRWATRTKPMIEAFMPFGGRSRLCLGIHLARTELRLATAHFFKAFPSVEISRQDGMSVADMEQVAFFLMSPAGKRCLVEVPHKADIMSF